MDYLAMIFPGLRRVHLPLSRDQIMLLMAATNEIFLGIDIYLAHSMSGTIVPNEWIPIIFGPIAGMVLLLAGLLALRQRPLATVLATVVFVSSIAVGLLGAYFHILRAILPNAPPGERVSVNLLVWAPPILGPLTFSLVGLLGISAAWEEDPPDSGRLDLLRGLKLRLPYSKTRAYIFMIGMGSLATVISSVLDHARTNFENPWLWLPTGVGVFGTVVAVSLGVVKEPRRGDVITYLGAMVLMILVGLLGSWLHINQNLTSQGTIVGERFLRGAPFLAPMLFSDMGALGILALLSPSERGRGEH
ncbi:MAG TPA: hypothetical protein VE136_14515 [Anaerolineales bacterium]|nr:hypothetical protein [Anaerolineales bacterium]